jgi:nitrate/nitrite-specific signal transduction histidine kinase
MGIAIMRERATAIQAQFEIESQRGKGTKLSLLWQASPARDLGEGV